MKNSAASIAAARRLLATGEARTIREAAGLSRADVAHDVGVDPATIWRWETLQRVPRATNAAQYAALLASLLGALEMEPPSG